jgi:Zn-dependent protease with chaperone function
MTSIDRARPGIATALAAGAALGLCTAAGVTPTDPMLLVEVVAASLIVAWAITVLADIRRSILLGRALDRRARPAIVHGVPVQIIQTGAVDAFAIGVLRPSVYVGEACLWVLDNDELAAVVLHEEHHRRTLAPLRATAVQGWLRILGRSAVATSLLTARLVQFEAAADAYAIARGVHPASIARALLKVQMPDARSAAFAGSADHRVRALTELAAGKRGARGTPLPYEWLPVVLAAAIAIGCHASELAGLLL